VFELTIQLQLLLLRKKDFPHESVNHVTDKVRFLGECVQCKITMTAYIKTRKAIANIMINQSAEPQFAQHRDCALEKIDVI
jgi:hypothetical protein